MSTIFEKIATGEIPAEFVYQDDICFAINDISPQAPVHILIIPRKVIPRLAEALSSDHSIIAHMLMVAKRIAADLKLENGFRVVINNGPDGGESVPHLHIHLLGGRSLTWPPG